LLARPAKYALATARNSAVLSATVPGAVDMVGSILHPFSTLASYRRLPTSSGFGLESVALPTPAPPTKRR
jgi:hypothetical protein